MKSIQENNLKFILANQKISYVKILDRPNGTKLFATDYNSKLTPDQVFAEIKNFSNESGLKSFAIQLKSSYSNKEASEYEVMMNGIQEAKNNPMDVNQEVERQVKNILERYQLEQDKKEVAEEKARLNMWGEKLQHLATPLINGIAQKYFAPLMMQGLDESKTKEEYTDSDSQLEKAIAILLEIFTETEMLQLATMLKNNPSTVNLVKSQLK